MTGVGDGFYGRKIDRMLRVLVATSEDTQSDAKGGNQLFAEKLVESINMYTPHNAELYLLPFREKIPDVAMSYLTAIRKKVSDYDVVLSIKFPSFCIRHPCHISLLNHRWKAFYSLWTETLESMLLPEKAVAFLMRGLLHTVDTQFLKRKRIIAQSHTIRRRLKEQDLDAEVAYPPSVICSREGGSYSYFLLPGRHDNQTKRIHLGINAMRHNKNDVRLVITGDGKDSDKLKRLAGDDERIIFTGHVSEEKMKELYSNALAVIFTPFDEDYGMVTVEAMKSGKPVITCNDSGGPTEFVRNLVNGFVVSPDDRVIARCMKYLADNPSEVRRMGRNGRDLVSNLTWEKYVDRVLGKFAHGAGTELINILTDKTKEAADWGRIKELSFHHGLSHVVYGKCRSTMPKKIREDFEVQLFKQKSVNNEFFRTFDEIKKLFRGIRYIPVKGIIKRRHERHMADIDIIVHKKDFLKAAELMKSKFVFLKPPNHIKNAGTLRFVSGKNKRILIEMETSVDEILQLEYDDLKDATEETHFCLEASHALFRHPFQNLKWMYESYEKLGKIDLLKCKNMTEKLGIKTIFETYLYLLKRIFDAPIDTKIGEKSKRKGRFLLSLHDFISPLEKDEKYELTRIAKVALSGKIKYFYRAFVPAKDEMTEETIKYRRRDSLFHIRNRIYIKKLLRGFLT